MTLEKKLKMALAGIAMLTMASTTPVNAAVIGGAETVGKGKLAVGAAGEYASDRKMNDSSVVWVDSVAVESEGPSTINFKGNVELKTEIKQMDREMLKVTYGLLKGLDVYGIFGMTGGQVKQNVSGVLDWAAIDEKASGKAKFEGKADINLKRNFAYGAGLKGNIQLPKEFLLGADVQGIFHKNKYSADATASYTESESGETASSGASFGGTMSFTEMQGSVYVAKKIGHFTPYVGGKYNQLNVENKTDYGETSNLKSKDKFGPMAGVGVKIGKNFMMALEGSMIGKSKQIGLEGRILF